MEFFNKTNFVKLQTHLNKFIVADDDKQTVRQSRNGSSYGAVWTVEQADENDQSIRLKSCHGQYLTATNSPYLTGMTGNKVLQTVPEKLSDLMIHWEPIRDGYQVKLKSWCGTYLRANGGSPPWRNSVTHDRPQVSKTKGWIFFGVHAVEGPQAVSGSGMEHLQSVASMSSVMTEDMPGSEPGSPMWSVGTKSSKSPRFSSKKINFSFTNYQSGMDLFHNAKAVRLRSYQDKYLFAGEDEESVTQDRNGSSKNARWTIEHVRDSESIIRLKSCYGKYLTASNQPVLVGFTGRKVLQTKLERPDSSVEWEPMREGGHVILKTRYGHVLRPNGGVPPWRNLIIHDVPTSRDSTQWGVDICEIQIQSSYSRQATQPIDHSDSSDDDDNGHSSPPRFNPTKSKPISRTESVESTSSVRPPAIPKSDGRTVYYRVADENAGGNDDAEEWKTFTFIGKGVGELIRKLEEETGLEDVVVCTKSPLNGKLYPLRLQLPPNNATMHVVVVPESSKVGGDFAREGLL